MPGDKQTNGNEVLVGADNIIKPNASDIMIAIPSTVSILRQERDAINIIH